LFTVLEFPVHEQLAPVLWACGEALCHGGSM
jgi:hypothetical protein